MNISAWIATTLSLLLGFGAAPALADHEYGNGRSNAVYDYARVIRTEPIIRYATVRTPVEECWTETQYYSVAHRPKGTAGGAIIGAIIGGVIGNQFGHGHHRDHSTVLGTVAGAAIGNRVAIANNGGYEMTQHSRPVRRCSTNYEVREEERIDGYNVIYLYNGQKYATRMPNDPGKRIRIRVDVRPVS